MAQSYEELEHDARSLAPQERARLVDVLLESLREGVLGEVELAWAAEIERRVEAYERGEGNLIAAADVFAKARLIANS